ncbi:hypothetical protein [uncultured Fretibacterium sp.]|uniref:hypothetical protein n=1 Tax=uncultured Fretibacterium sp. TaxID=1678694 RepID=UPI00261095D8|nr:hypothetical protein [uncultured Fretibacterium sp.]
MNGRAKRGFSLRRGRRSGFILITALVIILLGAALSVGVFALANSMLTTDVVNRKGYEEQTEVVRYIELAKGFIVTRNIELASRDEPVLHGQGGASNDYFVVRRLDDLQVCKPQAVGDVLSQDVLLSARGGERRLRLQVFDANYRVSDIRFATTPEMPPSLSPLSRISGGSGDGDSYEDEGEGTDPSRKSVSGDVVPMDYYKNYGAYMIRVEVYREGQSTPLRRTEEAFFQYVKKGT